MARTETEALVISLEARIRDFEKNFDKARKAANDNWGKIENRSDRAARKMQTTMGRATAGIEASFARMGRNVLGTMGAVFGAQGVLRFIQNAVAELGELHDAAEFLEIDPRSLLAFQRAAEDAGASANEMTDAIRRMTRRVGEFRNTAGGPAAEAIRQLGLETAIMSGNLTGTENILRAFFDRLSQIEDVGQRAAQASKIFGEDAGPKLAALLTQGTAAVDAQMASISEHTTEAARAADQLEQQLRDLGRNVDLIVTGPLASLLTVLNDILEAINKFPDSPLSNTAELVQKMADAASLLPGPFGATLKLMAEGLELAADLFEEEEKIADQETVRAKKIERQNTLLNTQVGIVKTIKDAIPLDVSQFPVPRERPFRFRDEEGKERTGRENLPELPTTDLDFDRDFSQGMIDDFNAVSEAIRKSKDEAGGLNDWMETLKVTTSTWGDVGLVAAHGIASGFASAIVRGESLEKVFSNLLAQIAEMIIQTLILKAIQASMSVFAGGFGAGVAHAGGTVGTTAFPKRTVDPAIFATAPRLHKGLGANEFPAILERGERVIPRDGGAGTVNNVVNVNVEGGSRGPEADRELAGRIGKAVQEAMRGEVTTTIREQMRPGNMLNQGVKM